MNKNIFIIRSPLQAFNAIEAKKRFSTNEQNIVIIFYRRELDKELILKTLAISNWSQIIVKKLKPHYQLFRFLTSFLQQHPSVNYCFIGDYSTLINFYMNRLKYKQLILLEDGTATLREIKLLENKTLHKTKKTAYSKKNFIQILMEKFIGIDQQYLYKASFFTIYDLKSNFPIVENDYSSFQENITLLPIKKKIFFIGSNLIDSILVSNEVFEKYLEMIVKYYKKENLDFYYILHRKEDENYMKTLSQRLEFECIKFNNIIEIEFLKLGYIPSEVSTFLSTAVTTLKRLYPTKYTFFGLNETHIKNQFKEPIAILKQTFLKEKIILNKSSFI